MVKLCNCLPQQAPGIKIKDLPNGKFEITGWMVDLVGNVGNVNEFHARWKCQ